MTTTYRVLSLAAFLSLAACAAEENPEPDHQLADEPATTGTPCGSGTWVATLETPTRSAVDFCVVADGIHLLRESGPLDVRSYLDTISPLLCADQVHAALAPGQRIPQALIDACRDSTATPLSAPVGEADELDTDGTLGEPRVPASHYCASGGDVEFEEERCSGIESHAEGYPWYDSWWWCYEDAASWTQLTATSQIGHRVNKLRGEVASCSGTTDVSLKAKVAGSWNEYGGGLVTSNYWASYSISTTTSLTDYDMRFVAESDDGYFRSTGYFGDYLGL